VVIRQCGVGAWAADGGLLLLLLMWVGKAAAPPSVRHSGC
jgi:hypothetical protein